jgi:hypothetical protein
MEILSVEIQNYPLMENDTRSPDYVMTIDGVTAFKFVGELSKMRLNVIEAQMCANFGHEVRKNRSAVRTLAPAHLQSGPKVTSLVTRSPRDRCVQHLRRIRGCDARIRREFGACPANVTRDARHSPRIMQTLRSPAARGARNKGCYFWTPLYSQSLDRHQATTTAVIHRVKTCSHRHSLGRIRRTQVSEQISYWCQ